MMLWTMLFFFFFWSQAWAVDSCGVVEHFGGNLELLDRSRLYAQEVKPHLLLPCGSWVSLKQGWIQIRHVSGAKIHGGVDTFFQLDTSERKHTLVVYHGEVFVDTTSGQESLLLDSPSARSWVRRAKVLWSVRDTTQLIALKHTSILENRLEPRYQVELHPGEFSILDLNLLRVTPSAPQVVSLVDLKWHLHLLQLKESDQQEAISLAQQRKRQVVEAFFKSKSKDFLKDPSHKTKKVERSIASLEASDWTEKEIEKSLVSHIAGNEEIEGIFHGIVKKKEKRFRVKAPWAAQKIKNQEEEENEKLLKQLARLPVR